MCKLHILNLENIKDCGTYRKSRIKVYIFKNQKDKRLCSLFCFIY